MNRIISINEWLVMVIVCVLTSVLDLTDYDGLRTFFLVLSFLLLVPAFHNSKKHKLGQTYM